MIGWYLGSGPEAQPVCGPQPDGAAGDVLRLLPVLDLHVCTGFALYGEGSGKWLLADRLFGWVIPLMGQSRTYTWHRLGMWGMVVFVTLHVYAAIREDIMGRQSIVSTMISATDAPSKD